MKKYILSIVVNLLIVFSSLSQSNYVAVQSLNLRSEANTDSEIVIKLSYCDNLEILKSSDVVGWKKVRFEGREGYVSQQFIKDGKCSKSTYSYRTGAMCKDGTRSSATGRGACSHHGGVSYWITKTKVEYVVEKN